MLSDTDRHRCLVEWNDTRAPLQDTCIDQLIAAQARATPDAPAIASGATCLTYRDLDARALRLAHRLRALGVGPEERVALCAERSPELLVGLLAVLKAGGAYVPMEPSYPTERLAFLLQDSGARVLLTQRSLEARLPGLPLPTLFLDSSNIGEENPEPLDSGATPGNLAYVIYTSGSTGAPKGVLVSHRNLVNYILDIRRRYGLSPADRVLQFASLAFDAAAEELFTAWTSGAALVLRPRELPAPGPELLRLIAEQRLTLISLPTAYWHAWTIELARSGARLPPCLRLVVVGNEAALPERLALWHRHVGDGVAWINSYGPTECTICSTIYPLPPAAPAAESAATVPIGRPVANTRAYVLDPGLQPVPIGAPGELHLGGEGVARGYLQRPDLTAERFIPDPFGAEPGVRLYRTGDLARWLPEGNLEFLGRTDHQVKLRGFRIELGEVEAALQQHPAVKEAIAVVQQHREDDKRLVAYAVPHEGVALSRGELRSFLRQKLPAHMVPSALVAVSQLPRTHTGKVDRGALPPPGPTDFEREGTLVPPRTPLEDTLAGIWRELLGIDLIGVDDDFFEAGGNSLLATQVVSRVREVLQVEVPLAEVFRAPTVARLASRLEEHRAGRPFAPLPPIHRIPRDRPLPVSFSQEQVWIMGALAPGTIAYNSQLILRFTGHLDASLLQRVLSEIVRRHESLRTTFVEQDGTPIQRVHPPEPVHLPVLDVPGATSAEREAWAERWILQEMRRPFDVSRLPLVCWTILRLADDEHLLVQVEHHFVHDGWSVAALVRELKALYAAFSNGQPSPLPELPFQFADFAAWQREWMAGEVLEAQLAWWKEQLRGSSTLELATDRPRPPRRSFRGALLRVDLPDRLYTALKVFGQQQGVTLFMTLLSAFCALLHRYTGQDDLRLGSAVANRRLRESEGLIGMLVGTVVLRADLAGNPTFRELLRRVRELALGVLAHQDLPFQKLVEALKPERDLSRNPLYQVSFSFHDSRVPDVSLPGLTGRHIELHNGSAKDDLNVIVIPWAEHLIGQGPVAVGVPLTMLWEYSTDLFEASTIDRMADHFQTLLEGALAHPEARVAGLPLLTAAERQRLLHTWNETRAPLPEGCIHELIAAQARATPDAPAVVSGADRLTYRELDRRAHRLARRLRALGVGPEERVALCAERSPELLVGLLAVLKAGGAYVPLDPSSPAERLAFLLRDSGARVLLARELLRSRLPELSIPLLPLDSADPGEEGPEPPSSSVTAQNLAYVVYTSGSTGTPKGVLVSHRGLVNHAVDLCHRYGLSSSDRVLQFASLAFDVAAEELFPTWLAGAAVVLRPPELPAPGEELLRFIEAQRISVVNLPASYWHEWTLELARGGAPLPACLRRVVVGSEAASPERLAWWQRHVGPGVAWTNAYGPSECTITSTVHSPAGPREAGSGAAVPIGRPIANTRAYVLDPRLQPVPPGVPGELHLGGVGLARGYLHRPDLTAERFIPDPFGGEPGARLYRTGDLVRWLPDGVLEFLGRTDHQVKLRGFRIELGEIEAALRQHPAVREAVAVVREPAPGDPRLVAYVVAGAAGDRELRDFLREKLPGYMVPWAIVALPALPLTPGGKIDRLALPPPEAPEAGAPEPVPPGTPLEEALATLWARILKLPRVGIHDSFFDLGGHSLLAGQLLFRIRQELQVALPLSAIYQSPTVAGLAAAVEALRRGEPSAGPRPGSSRDSSLEIELPPDIQPGPGVPATAAEPGHLLLTGATGFLGAFLLRALLDRTQARIHCLVRAPDEAEAARRLRKSLDTYGLWREADRSRIAPVAGDLSRPLLGLTTHRFSALADEVEAVYHNGAAVNFLHAYEQLEAPNVLGTREILRLATRGAPKPVHYVSTLSVLKHDGAEHAPRREVDVPERAPGADDGYSRSKWAAERLLIQARARGLPVTIYRPGRVTGHARTGVGGTGDYLCRILKGCIQLGLAPEVDAAVDLTPVDFVCEALVHLSRQPTSAGRIFHLINPEPASLGALFEHARGRGYTLRAVPYPRWRAALEDALARGTEENALHPLLPMLAPEELPWDHARYECRDALAALAGSAIACPSPGSLLDPWFGYLIRSGFLAPPGPPSPAPPSC